MLTKDEAVIQLKKLIPLSPIKAWTEYQNFYLFRVEHPSPLEKNWDPFFSVDKTTGEARDFSILSDLDVISELNWIEL